MRRFEEIRKSTEKKSTVIAIACTVLSHVALCTYGIFNGLTYLSPPPPEQSMLIDFSEIEEVEKDLKQLQGSTPRSEEPDRTKPVTLVQKSEAQEKGATANEAQEATMGDDGDVEKYEPPREKPIEKRALFHAPANKSDKDTLAAHTASEVSDALKEGHAKGNTPSGKTIGAPSAKVKGRNVVGGLAKPAYTVQEQGVVVVTVWVDQYGTVTRAQAGATGTTVNNSTLWNAARDAAMKTKFNTDGDAPAMQQGTITYIFELKGR